MTHTTQAGYVGVIGRPNVGKSTLINRLLGHKINITSRKPQTTRTNVLGIKTEVNYQAIFVDTPGLHQDGNKAINRLMNRSAESVIHDVDVLLMVIERLKWTDEDEHVWRKASFASCPTLLVINKVDTLENKNSLLPFIAQVNNRHTFEQTHCIAARSGLCTDELMDSIVQRLPVSDFFYDAQQITDKTERFLVAEIVREKLMRQLGNEMPYAVAVDVEQFTVRDDVAHIGLKILVERDSQKAIVIGKNGQRLKSIGIQARQDIEQLLGTKAMITLWVKTKTSWADDERTLTSLGYTS